MADVQSQPMTAEIKEGESLDTPAAIPLDATTEVQLGPPPYMPPPYPTGPDLYPTPLPPQGGFVAPDLPRRRWGACPNQKSPVYQVFSVVTLQLLVTFSVVCIFTFSSVVRLAVQKNIWIYVSSVIVFFVVSICLLLSGSFSRKHPWNLIGLSLITLSMSFMVGTVASFHDTFAVVMAMGATLVISFTIIIFTAQTRVNFSVCNGILLVLAADLLMFGFFSCFFYSRLLHILYGCLGALAYSLFLAIDCQLVMGREKYSLSPEEYVFAALILYLDIIMIFLYILLIFGGGSKN